MKRLISKLTKVFSFLQQVTVCLLGTHSLALGVMGREEEAGQVIADYRKEVLIWLQSVAQRDSLKASETKSILRIVLRQRVAGHGGSCL